MIVKCTECQRDCPVEVELEPTQIGRHVCDECVDKKIFLNLLDFIKERIALTRTEDENFGRFGVRELVQNADDAHAEIMVLRFEDDALYVANDGRAFSTSGQNGELGDFERIVRILKRHQADDEETTGHFGSGFQTVYAFTNHPEVHSGGRSVRMDPVKQRWKALKGEKRFISPFVWKEEKKGALFRFPWRDEKAANERFGDDRSFLNVDDWPRWNMESRREMYDDLKGYLHQVILCCKNLRTLRIVWSADDDSEAYQVERDFTMNDVMEEPYLGVIREGGDGQPGRWFEWGDRFSSEKSVQRQWSSFLTDSWTWAEKSREYRYLVCPGRVHNDRDEILYVGRNDGGSTIITSDSDELVTTLKRNDVHVLLPLHDAESRHGDRGRAFLYSTIPLPRRGGNYFAFTGHFFPEEGRKDVAVSSLEGISGEWHRAIVLSVATIYKDVIPKFIDEVKSLEGIEESDAELIMLNSLPGISLHEWMRPGKEHDSAWAEKTYESLLETALSLPIMWTGKDWVPPVEAFWAREGGGVNEENLEVLRIMGVPAFTKSLVSHRNFSGSVRECLGNRELTSEAFESLFGQFEIENQKEESKGLVYGQRLSSGYVLGKEETMALVKFCITREGVWESTRKLAVVPGEDGTLRPISAYPIIPPGFEDLENLLTPSISINEDYENELKEVEIATRKLNPDGVVSTISHIVKEDSGRWKELSPDDHTVLSRLILALARHEDFSLKQSHVGLLFIPYTQDGAVKIGPPNAHRASDGKEKVFLEKRSETYGRYFIFSPPTSDVPGLTEELAGKIRFLSLLELDEREKKEIADKLFLTGLQEGRVPTDLVRHFLSNRHKSLFFDEILSAFLEIKNEGILSQQKLEFQKALKAYYSPSDDGASKKETYLKRKDMAKVPCLYDTEGKWHRAGHFGLEMRPEVELLGYKALHQDFDEWPNETLSALGVAQRPESEKIIEEVTQLVREPEKNRSTLANVVALIITSETPWEDKLKELESLSWIPVMNSTLEKPEDVLIPSSDIREIIGEDYPCLFDSEACSRDFIKYLEGEEAQVRRDRLKELGIPARPTAKMMMSLVDGLRDTSRNPPPKLFEALNDRVREETLEPIGEGYYFWKDKWWKHSSIFLHPDMALASAMGDKYAFIPSTEVTNHITYLNHIGVRDGPNTKNLLDRLVSISEESVVAQKPNSEMTRLLWERLEELAEQVDDNLASLFKDVIFYPVEGDEVVPSRIVLAGRGYQQGLFRLSGLCGSYFVLHGQDCQHGRILRALGAKAENDLNPRDIQNILESVGTIGNGIDEAMAETAVRLLARISELDDNFDLTGAKIWPTVTNGEHALSKLDECYLRDDPAARHFDEVLTFLFDKSDGIIKNDLRSLALYQDDAPTSFVYALKKEEVEFGGEERDENSTLRLALMARALRSEFQGEHKDYPESIDWLLKTEVRITSDLRITLRVGDVVVPANPPCISWDSDEGFVIYRVNADPTLYDRLTEEIVDKCEAMGMELRDTVFSDDVSPFVLRSDICNKVYRMLTRSPDEWHLFMDRIDRTDHWLPPLMEFDLERREGYAETRQRLLEWYGYCQICGKKTPANESTGDTCEKVRSVVSMRGGAYKGRLSHYDTSNSIFLCPRHHTLYERKLIRLPDLDKAKEEGTVGAERLRGMGADWKGEIMSINVYEASDENLEPQWYVRSLNLKPDHATGMLEYLADWVEENSDEQI